MLLHVWQTLVAMRTGEQLHILYGRILLRGTNGRGAGVAAEARCRGIICCSCCTHNLRMMSGNASKARTLYTNRERERKRGRERERERTLLANNKEEEKDVLCARQLTFSHFPLAAGHVARERETRERERQCQQCAEEADDHVA